MAAAEEAKIQFTKTGKSVSPVILPFDWQLLTSVVVSFVFFLEQ